LTWWQRQVTITLRIDLSKPAAIPYDGRRDERTENRQMGDYAKALGAKLRGIRQQQGLSLHGVEQKSGGRWKAVVVGSYERGDRAVTVQKLAELADFYGVPVVELLPEGRVPSGAEPATKIVINLERLQQLPAEKVGPLARYAATIQSQRGDYNGKVLSIRTEDLRSLAIIYDMTPGELTEQLIDWGVLPPEARPSKED
jgi:transcriptional regulator with XRE-family HTH domain